MAKFLNNSYWESKEKLVIHQFRGRYYRKVVKNELAYIYYFYFLSKLNSFLLVHLSVELLTLNVSSRLSSFRRLGNRIVSFLVHLGQDLTARTNACLFITLNEFWSRFRIWGGVLNLTSSLACPLVYRGGKSKGPLTRILLEALRSTAAGQVLGFPLSTFLTDGGNQVWHGWKTRPVQYAEISYILFQRTRQVPTEKDNT